MKHSWQIIGSKFEALNPRERWMVACALLVVVYAVINMLLIGPVLERQKILTRELEADQMQLQDLNQQISEFSRQPVIDPDTQNKQRIGELQSHLQVLETRLNHLQTTLINPDKMPELLRGLLKKNGNLKLIELKTLPVKGLLESSAEGAEQDLKQDVPVFRHGVEITIEGRYLDLLEYVAELEKMPWHVLWSKAALNAEHYPDSQLTLTVYTLSLDKTWLSI